MDKGEALELCVCLYFYKLDQNLDSLVKDGPIRSVLFSEQTIFFSQQISISQILAKRTGH